MTVRFKEQYSESNPPIAYELISEEKVWEVINGLDEICYQTKLFGLMPVRKMEIINDDGTN